MNDLRQFCTDRQLEYVEAIIKHGSQGKAASSLGVARPVLSRAIAAVKKKAAVVGIDVDAAISAAIHNARYSYDPNKSGIDQLTVRPIAGTTTLHRFKDKDDTTPGPVLGWVKEMTDKEAQAQRTLEHIGEVIKDVVPFKPQKLKGHVDADLLTIYPLGDPHIGMYAWAQEAGEDFDCDIARQDLTNAMGHLVAASKPSRECIVLNVGDFFHADDPSNATPQNKNPLDVDGRFERVLSLGLFLMVDLIDMALHKHEIVRVRNLPGNHDPKTVVPMSLFLLAWFRNEPRVIIESSSQMFQYYRFGKCLFGFTHGHKIRKAEELGALMAVDRPEDWGVTEFRYWLHGHYHIKRLLEVMGCTVECVRNLPPNDAWHQHEGYRSGRDMMAITYHKDHGEVNRATCNISVIRTPQEKQHV